MRYLLIANPISGLGRAKTQTDYVVSWFKAHGQEIDLALTGGPGDAEVLARAARSRGYDVIIAGGGDGTINEVLNGMVGGGQRLAVIPWGTGNVFATEMGFPRRLGAVCRMILQGQTEALDLGIIEGRLFLLMVGAGFDAYSLKQLEGQGLKRRLGVLAYALAALRAFTRYSFPQIDLEFEDGRRDSGSFVLVSNTSRYGDIFSFTPRATPLDGLLDVFVFREKGRWQTIFLVLRYLLRFLAYTNLAAPPLGLQRTRIYRTTGVRLCSSRSVYTQVDGELDRGLPLSIRVLPGAIDLIIPARKARHFRRHLGEEGGDAGQASPLDSDSDNSTFRRDKNTRR